jgi:hypothetical protein
LEEGGIHVSNLSPEIMFVDNLELEVMPFKSAICVYATIICMCTTIHDIPVLHTLISLPHTNFESQMVHSMAQKEKSCFRKEKKRKIKNIPYQYVFLCLSPSSKYDDLK